MKSLARVMTGMLGLWMVGNIPALAKLPQPYHLLACSADGKAVGSFELPSEIGKVDHLFVGEKLRLHMATSRAEDTGKLQLIINGSGPSLEKYRNVLSLKIPKASKQIWLTPATLKPDSGLRSPDSLAILAIKDRRNKSFTEEDKDFKCYTHLDAKVPGLPGSLTCVVCTNHVKDLQTVIDGGSMTIAPEEKSGAVGAP